MERQVPHPFYHLFSLTLCSPDLETAAMRKRPKKEKGIARRKRLVEDDTIEAERRYVFERLDGKDPALPVPNDEDPSEEELSSEDEGSSSSIKTDMKNPPLPGMACGLPTLTRYRIFVRTPKCRSSPKDCWDP